MKIPGQISVAINNQLTSSRNSRCQIGISLDHYSFRMERAGDAAHLVTGREPGFCAFIDLTKLAAMDL